MEAKESPLITVAETAEYLRLSKSTILKLIESYDIPALKIGRAWRIHKPELDQWIEDEITYKNYVSPYFYF
jgi:excisionase family DNA binding protein